MNNLLAYIQFHIIKCITALLCHHFITATLSLSLNFNDQIAYILKIDYFHACIRWDTNEIKYLVRLHHPRDITMMASTCRAHTK